jgi:hypothetical protein
LNRPTIRPDQEALAVALIYERPPAEPVPWKDVVNILELIK